MYSFHPTIVIRTPRLAFQPTSLSEANIKELLHEDWFLEAIFLASPSLYRTAIAWRDGATLEKRKEEKLWASLTKYYSRMMSRCTPFGLFASCSALKWGEATPILLSQQDTIRHTRLDMHFLCALALSLAQNPNIRPYLSYFPNSSLYPVGNELRYVEYVYAEGRRNHQISGVDTTDYLQRILATAQTGACYVDLIGVLINDEITASDAQLFIDELIAAQLLVSELEPAITGVSFLSQILQVLRKVFAQAQSSEVGFIINQLEQIHPSIDRLDSQKINSIADYERLIELLKTLHVPIEENKLFQTDLFRELPQGQLPLASQQDLQAALEVLNRLSTKRKNGHLEAFAQRFLARYDTQEVPLLEALDTEIGIGYLANQGTPLLPLVEDIAVPAPKENKPIEWNPIQEWLFRQLQTLLHPATWQLQKKHIDALLTDQPLLDVPPFQDRLVTLADGDNELIVDWANPLSVRAFKDAIKNRTQLQLKEFLYEPTQPTFQDPISQNGFVNQCIALLVRNTSAYVSSLPKRPSLIPTRRFSIGSEWLYFKLYGGVKVADKILVAFIKPLCEELQRSHLMDKWFFIRYSDPDPHLRIRFHLRNVAQLGDVIRLFYQFLQPALEANYLWKIQADTYERELERYGFEVIELAETLFYYDSEAIVAFLDQTEGDLREEVRWLYGMRAIDALLDSFDFDFQQKIDLLNSLRNSFAREFNMDVALKQQLDHKYRLHRSTIRDIFSDYPANLPPFLLVILSAKSANIASIVDEIIHSSYPSQVAHWLGSYIHMLLNRLIPAHQRLHELVIYDFLCRHYQSSLYLELCLK